VDGRPWYLDHGILPGDGEEFLVAADRDALALTQEIFCIHGRHICLRQISQKDFAARWDKIYGQRSCEHRSRRDDRPTANGVSQTIQLCNDLLAGAVAAGASDMHWEWERDAVVVRLRVDGELRPTARLPKELGNAIAIRLKALAQLSPTEHFRPQDGRLCWQGAAGQSADFRIATLPTRWGESIAIRVLDRNRPFFRVENLAMPPSVEDGVRRIAAGGGGLFLATGPTGSGKTTTLYAILAELICRGQKKILTVEDPVEYVMEGALQVAVDLAVGRTFSTVLRAFLRHDPDVIFVGEIRDGETAEVALRAALTGHLVLATLHTATAEEALLRLTELGLDQNLLLSCLRAILCQRLLRTNCPHCREPMDHTAVPDSARAFFQKGQPTWHAMGCSRCEKKGYLGRHAIFSFQWVEDGQLSAPSLLEEGRLLLETGQLSIVEFLRQLPWDRPNNLAT
jgi:general secretion pathway protein E